MPAPDPLTKFFWDGLKEHKLMILRCQSCGHYIHWPRPVCRFCLSTDLAPAQVSGKATLYSWTIAVQPFHPFFVDKVPYVIATVELVEQKNLKMVSNLIDCPEEKIRAGMPLQVVFKEVAPGFTLPLFRPA
jgi:uncharacterized OB-fold protein